MTPAPISKVDLLIIGAGPAGLIAAAWASQFRVSTRIIDKKAARVPNGHADGVHPRTLEIFDSFRFVDRPLKEGYHEIEICSWVSLLALKNIPVPKQLMKWLLNCVKTPDQDGRIQRTQRVISQKPGISMFQEIILNQGAIEQTIMDFLKLDGRVQVERNLSPERLSLDRSCIQDSDAYPITVSIGSTSNDEEQFQRSGNQNKRGRVITVDNESLDRPRKKRTKLESHVGSANEIIKAKYLIGCDGAHSWTRKQLGISLEGEQTDDIWGVMDIIPLTDFPDIRQSCAVQSATFGSIMTVPRDGRLVRLYVHMKEFNRGGIFKRSQISPVVILEAAKNIMAPFTLSFHYCEWWSVYQVGRRVAPKFDVDRRIFLAGDAVHTHSPTLGQGMNVSMQDAYNLCWKICAVIKGVAKPAILDTYQSERHKLAQELMRVDREAMQFYTDSEISNVGFEAFREQYYEFLSGVAVKYDESILVASPTDHELKVNGTAEQRSRAVRKRRQSLARNIKLGARLPSFKVLNQADARPTHIAKLLPSDGRWRIIVFAGDLRDAAQFARVQALGHALASPTSILHTYTPSSQPIDSVIEVLTIHSGPRDAVELLSLPDIYHPWDEQTGWDYWKVYADAASHHEGFDRAYENYGIDPRGGCVVACRPDQHVGYVGRLDDGEGLEGYFAGILNPRT